MELVENIMSDRNRANLSVCLMLFFSLIAMSGPMKRQVLTASLPEIVSTVTEDTAATVQTEQTAQESLPARKPTGRVLTGIASWYGEHWQGRKTASGARFDIAKLTAAHRSLPLNTIVRVTNLSNGRSVEVLVNDRGPYVGRRVLDLSEAAAKRLDMIKKGLAPVRIETILPQDVATS
jgi:rare lipoprotein A